MQTPADHDHHQPVREEPLRTEKTDGQVRRTHANAVETLCNCILVNHTNNNCVYTECSSYQLSFIEMKEGRNCLDNDCHNYYLYAVIEQD